MSDNDNLDVLIAVYLIPDLAQQDFDAYTKLAGDGGIVTDGVALVIKDTEGQVHVQETGDHLGRKGVKVGAGAGLVIGLFAPPLLAATAVGAAVGGLTGKFARHRTKAGIGDKLDDALNLVRSQASNFGSNLIVLQTRQDFTKQAIATLNGGSDLLTLADTSEEGANLLALQTRQQLSTQALSLSAQTDQAVLRLFG